MDVQKLALAQGMDQTRAALARWNDRPAPVIASWLIGAFAFACGLLIAVLAVASVATPDRTALYMPGLFGSADASDYAHVLVRNLLVLSLHAVACVGGFIACASLPFQAEHMTGFNRWIHERASRVAIAWIALVTCFSLVTQAYILGSTGAQLASQLVISPTTLVATVLPHALIELTAVFLPLAAWTIAARRGSWDELLAATVATVAIAVPMLLLAAAWETWLWPQLLQQASPLSFTFTPG
jgi:hypothetical protein